MGKKKRNLFGTRNKVRIESCERHMVPVFGPAPDHGPDARVKAVYFAEGVCNDDRFGAVVIASGTLEPAVDMYGKVMFEFHEGKSVGLILVTRREETVTVEHPEIETYDQAAAFVREMRESGRQRFGGPKVFLDVPFTRKEEAKSLGARWDVAERKWFVMSNLVDMDDFSQWLPEGVFSSCPAMGT